MENKHTAGQWKADFTNPNITICNEKECIATVWLNSETEANAKLIAAAPELLEALKECKAYFEYMKGENHVSSRDARSLTDAAINKATN